MSALHALRYLGGAGLGMGALYIGKGVVLGIDAGNNRYCGSYVEQDGRLVGTVTLSMPSGGALVTGAHAPPGAEIAMTIDWPTNFDILVGGTPQKVIVNGQPVQVTLEKVGDVP